MNLGTIKDKTGKTILRKHSVKKAVSMLAVCCVAVIAVTAAVSLATKPEETPVLENPSPTSVETKGNTVVSTKQPTLTPMPTPEINVESENDTPASSGATVKTTMILPVTEGNVLKGYASDSLVYSNTLKHWAAHTALDISAPAGTIVLSAADGTISSITEDDLMGLTVTVSHDSGLETVYSSLESVPDEITEGTKVLKGQAIGAVGTSASSESSDGAHLHFEVLQNGKSINPQSYLNDFAK